MRRQPKNLKSDRWEEARARLPGYSLLRVIDLDAGTDRFEIVRAQRRDPDCLDMLLDGWTLVKPALEAGRTDAELAAIIEEFDARWRKKVAVPDTPATTAVDR